MVILYKTTCSVNGKYYIGVHSLNNPKYLGSGVHLKRAVAKYGEDMFHRETLEEFDCIEDAYQREMELVTEQLVNDPECYNIMGGGRGGKHRKCSQETKSKMSESAKARMERDGSPTAGTERSSETKQKISDNRKASGVAKGENNPMYGKSRADTAARNKMSKRWMHKDGVTKLVLLANVEEMQSQGYEFGRPTS